MHLNNDPRLTAETFKDSTQKVRRCMLYIKPEKCAAVLEIPAWSAAAAKMGNIKHTL